VRIGGLFAGESMFSDATDASKVALVSLVEWLVESGAALLDVQWTTPHLVSIGAVDVPRPVYLQLLAQAIRR
jgi:leucyl/phenylalanyl-tRNA--protein transferase